VGDNREKGNSSDNSVFATIRRSSHGSRCRAARRKWRRRLSGGGSDSEDDVKSGIMAAAEVFRMLCLVEWDAGRTVRSSQG
jgi:hypothetical protein